MNQETRWLTRYNEVKEFILENKRNPSKYRIEEHDMLNWLKATRKRFQMIKVAMSILTLQLDIMILTVFHYSM